LELKVNQLEEAIKLKCQQFAAHTDRINYLDREMKLREQEGNRKLNEIMTKANDRNTLISQVPNYVCRIISSSC